MNKKKKSAAALASPDARKYITKKLSVQHINTPLRIGQLKFSSITAIHTKPENERRGRARCYCCLQWFETLASFGLWVRPSAAAIKYGLCRKCSDSLRILPPNLQRKFAEKCEKNLLNALEVKIG